MRNMARFILAALIFAIPLAASEACSRCRQHAHWYYNGYHRQDIYRYGPPENGGYRDGYYGGRYHDNTHYDD
jgi:hypothetical protein